MHWRWRERFGSAALVFGVAYLSHLVLDYFTIDTRPPAGAQFLWPYSSAYFLSPLALFGEISIDGRTRSGFLSTVLAWPTVVVLAREMGIAVVVVGLWLLVEAWRRRSGPARLLVLGRGEEDLA